MRPGKGWGNTFWEERPRGSQRMAFNYGPWEGSYVQYFSRCHISRSISALTKDYFFLHVQRPTLTVFWQPQQYDITSLCQPAADNVAWIAQKNDADERLHTSRKMMKMTDLFSTHPYPVSCAPTSLCYSQSRNFQLYSGTLEKLESHIIVLNRSLLAFWYLLHQEDDEHWCRQKPEPQTMDKLSVWNLSTANQQGCTSVWWCLKSLGSKLFLLSLFT